MRLQECAAARKIDTRHVGDVKSVTLEPTDSRVLLTEQEVPGPCFGDLVAIGRDDRTVVADGDVAALIEAVAAPRVVGLPRLV